MEQKTKTDLSPYVVNIQGKDFITFPGLLAEAHAQGLVAIDTNLINNDLNNPVVKATVAMKDPNAGPGPSGVKSFTGYGDANANNVAKKVAGALLRMAETRAVARALRFACNIDMTALEELGGDGADIPDVPTKSIKVPVKIGAKVAQPTIAAAVAEAKVDIAPPVIEETKTEKVPAKQISFAKRPTTAKLEVQNKTEPNF
jgi:hypothetical protein